jgi:DNA primase
MFRHRVIFTIHDQQGRSPGSSAATCPVPTARRSTSTPATRRSSTKGCLLHGLHEGRPLAGVQPVLVEGPLDVLAIAAHTPSATPDCCRVAPSGTALTTTHAQQRRTADMWAVGVCRAVFFGVRVR